MEIKNIQNEKLVQLIKELNELSGINALKAKGSKIYLVGGVVRDALLDKPIKDIDLLITKLPAEQLLSTLSEHGNCDLVGESFGIYKFRPNDAKSDLFKDLDIALPRTEKKVGNKHTDFSVIASHEITIEEDSQRRDFTINTLLFSLEGEFIDLHEGYADLQNRVLRHTNDSTFVDDPLRILRAIQFASRFDLYIAASTKNLIKKHAPKLEHVSKERVLIEMEKMVFKGSGKAAAQLITSLGVQYYMFNRCFGRTPDYTDIIEFKTIAQFMHSFYSGWGAVDPKLEQLALPTSVIKEFKGLHMLRQKAGTIEGSRIALFESYMSSAAVLDFDVYYPVEELRKSQTNSAYYMYHNRIENTQRAIYEFKIGILPKHLNELVVNGFDLLELGYKGKEIGVAFKKIVRGIMTRKIENDKTEILQYLGH